MFARRSLTVQRWSTQRENDSHFSFSLFLQRLLREPEKLVSFRFFSIGHGHFYPADCRNHSIRGAYHERWKQYCNYLVGAGIRPNNPALDHAAVLCKWQALCWCLGLQPTGRKGRPHPWCPRKVRATNSWRHGLECRDITQRLWKVAECTVREWESDTAISTSNSLRGGVEKTIVIHQVCIAIC